jgi:hypothetical protein
MRSRCGLNRTGGEAISRRTRPPCLEDSEEVFGPLHSVASFDEETVIVQIGQRAVVLPRNLKLPRGGTVFVLRLDDKYYVGKADPGEVG